MSEDLILRELLGWLKSALHDSAAVVSQGQGSGVVVAHRSLASRRSAVLRVRPSCFGLPWDPGEQVQLDLHQQRRMCLFVVVVVVCCRSLLLRVMSCLLSLVFGSVCGCAF